MTHRLNNDQLLNILVLSKDATAVYTGEELTIEIANDAMIGFWGKDRSVIGRSFIEAVPELVGQPFFDLLREVWRTGVTYEATDMAAQLRVGGKLQWFYYDFIYRAIKNDEGEVYCILHTATDVTDRHIRITEGLGREQDLQEELTATNEELQSANAEVQSTNEALSLSRKQLLQLNAELEQRVSLRTGELKAAQAAAEWQSDRITRFFMQAPAGICIMDGPDLVFELINPSYQQLFSERELLGRPLLEALPEIKGQQ
jgi:two-component system sensor histidine kinase VicK